MIAVSKIAENYITVARDKTSRKWYKTLILAVLAGAFIAFGAAVSTAASNGFEGGAAATVKGAVFPVGLILVVVCGAELFTGNCLLVSPMIERKIGVLPTLKNLGIVYLGNLIGGVLIAVLVVFCGAMSDGVTASTVATAAAKCNMNFGEAVLRGVLCNMLVCLAVWASMASGTTAGKILAVYLPVFAFVACGFEHSVANMYYLTAGLIAQAVTPFSAAGLELGNALVNCLIPSTLGNIIGGGLIAVAYYAVCRAGRKANTAAVEAELSEEATAKDTENAGE